MNISTFISQRNAFECTKIQAKTVSSQTEGLCLCLTTIYHKGTSVLVKVHDLTKGFKIKIQLYQLYTQLLCAPKWINTYIVDPWMECLKYEKV